ncbi:MAG: cation-transporting P-type ATPase [Candidatus Fermentibacteraceae bacterium]
MEGTGNGASSPPYARTADAVLRSLDAGREGLTREEARRRLEGHGPNSLPTAGRSHPVLRFLGHFNDVLIYVLLAAAAGTALLGHWIDTWIILGVVLINGVVGFLQEGKAESAIAAVRNMLSVTSRVLRDGVRMTIEAEKVVPGDIVILSSGDRVPADLRLLSVHELRVNESSLTGESQTVLKETGPVKADSALGDRSCMAYSGTIVASGTAEGVVVATGGDTEIGRISRLLTEVEELTTPLLRQVNRFGIYLSGIILAVSSAVFVAGLLLAPMSATELFMSVVGIAVAAIPEGLPAVMSIILAMGVRRMAGRNAIIRRLPGVETLGSVGVICTDKTGTLTRSEMTVTRVALAEGDCEVKGIGYAPKGGISCGGRSADPDSNRALGSLLAAGALCNDARIFEEDGSWLLDGDPTEGALLTLAAKAGVHQSDLSARWQRLDAIPFESDHKFMATLHQGPGERRIYIKGAPEAVLRRCSLQMSSGGDTGPLDEEGWRNRADELAGRGFRLLALAMAEPKEEAAEELTFQSVEGGLTLLGLAAMTDPPRPEAIAAVEECQGAGIRVKMITGDHALTARSIAREMGIGDGGEVVTGPEIDRMSDSELTDRVEEVDVYARVSPENKLRLVTALQGRAHVTAMTGDGVNDAPALKKADIGIAMGLKGTEAAKEAADMVLADDNFASIAHAVEEGRTVYSNFRKTLLFMLPTNAGEALVIVMAVVLGLVVVPITPAQVLWVNMVTAVTLALALAFEPMETGVMESPPRPPDEPLVPVTMLLRIGYVSVLLMAGALGIFMWYRSAGASLGAARTVAVNTLIMGEVFYLFNCRYMRNSSLTLRGLRATPQVWGAAALVLLVQVPFTYLPMMQGLFGTEALAPVDWARMVALGAAIFLVVEAEKALVRRRAMDR